VKSLIVTALEFAIGFAPQEWRAFAFTVLTAVRNSSWMEDDEQWVEVAKVVEGWLRDVMQARANTDSDLVRQMRMAAELYATRELQRLNMLEKA
jgi:hypothetical protein